MARRFRNSNLYLFGLRAKLGQPLLIELRSNQFA